MILECSYCGLTGPSEEVELDSYNQGFWCGDCDSYTYFDPSKAHKFTLLLETKSNLPNTAPVVSSDIKFKKRLSCFRYPGGKSKMIPIIYSKIRREQRKQLIGAYAGGASAELALLEAGVFEKLVLNDYDFGIYALYWTIKHAPYDLIYRLQSSSSPTVKDYFHAQKIIKKDYPNCNILDAAWYTLIVNRLAYSGIYKANPLGGKNGKTSDLLSRWNPKALIKRINEIHDLSDRITVLNEDACNLIEEYYWHPETTIFVDPPFVQKGEDLYRCYYKKQDHIDLCVLLESLHSGMPGADIIVTYDDDPLIRDLYYIPETETIHRYYSI